MKLIKNERYGANLLNASSRKILYCHKVYFGMSSANYPPLSSLKSGRKRCPMNVTTNKWSAIALLAFGASSLTFAQKPDESKVVEKKADETTQSPRERGRVLQKLNPIASEHQTFGDLGRSPGSDRDGEGVDYRSYFSTNDPFEGPTHFADVSVSLNYNDLSGKSEVGGRVNGGKILGANNLWFVKAGARTSASDRIIEHYQSSWAELTDRFGLGENVYFLDRPRFSEDLIYTRNDVYSFEVHRLIGERTRLYYKTSVQDYFDNSYRNRLELQFASGTLEEDSFVLGDDGESVVGLVSEDARTRRYFGDTDTNRLRQHHVIGGAFEGDVWEVDASVYFHKWEIDRTWHNWNFNDFGLNLEYQIGDPNFPDYEVLSGPDLGETDTARYSNYRLHQTETSDEDLAARIDAERSLEIGDSVYWLQVGALYREKSRSNSEDRDVYSFNRNAPFYLSEVAKDTPIGETIVDSRYARPTGMDPIKSALYFEENPDSFVLSDYSSQVESAAQLYSAFESVTSGYALTSFEKGKWTVELGARYEMSKTSSVGRVVIPESVNDPNEGTEIDRVIVPGSGEVRIIKDLYASNSYSNFLPSLEIDRPLNDWLTFRASWFTSLMRPQYYNIVNYRRVSVPTRTVSEGNPLLSPTKIEKSRLALISKSESLGAFSFELYSIDIEDFFYGAVSYDNVVENGVPIEYSISRVENGESGKIRGAELQWERGLDFLPFGKDASFRIAYTYSDSEASVSTRPNDILLVPERSKHLLKLDLRKRIGNNTTLVNFGYQSRALDDLGVSTFRDEYREDVLELGFMNTHKLSEKTSLSFRVSGLLDHPERSYEGSSLRVMGNQYSSWNGSVTFSWNL